jgi:eukaryotic-like serine/threonine-protein kinase
VPAELVPAMVGELALRRFRILERIGSGGMGVVYRAFDERLEREVAVKEIPGADSDRVLHEAKAAARLNHPSIATLYEFGAVGDDAILVSELANGEPLGELAAAGELTDREIAEVGLDVCAALAHAHQRGVVHRDVKPANVVVEVGGPRARAKLMDFGIAALADEARLTATGEVIGTLAYMAPERADGGGAGEAADVYSLALTLYECWTGVNPVAGATPAETARRIGGLVPSLATLRPDLPAPLRAAIDACLLADPLARPTTPELAEALRHELGGLESERLLAGTRRAADGHRHGSSRSARVALVLALAGGLWALAGPAGKPGLALVVGVLAAPGLLFTSSLEQAFVPLLAPLLGAVSLGLAYPAVAGRRGGGAERALLGGLGWFWLAAGSVALEIGPELGLGPGPRAGWMESPSAAAHGVLAPLLDPGSLAAALAFAAAAWAMGPILRAGHVALAFICALLWSAGLTAALRAAGDPATAANPLVAVVAVAAVIVLAHRERIARRHELLSLAGSS